MCGIPSTGLQLETRDSRLETPAEAGGLILEIQRMSTEDGPGIRTTVFFKGCPLRCSWCHNPESISPRPQIHWMESRCIGCGSCREACTGRVLQSDQNRIVIQRELCTACGACVEACPAGAMEMLGRTWPVGDLVREVLKDRAYFSGSGGVTLGGGEPSLQPRFAAVLLEALQKEGIRTALDTCGLCAPGIFETLLSFTNLVLYDLKEIDPERHRRFTGVSNEIILANAGLAADRLGKDGHPQELWIRTPVIPGTTASAGNIRGIGTFIRTRLHGAVSRWDLCAFNNLCRDKYRRLDILWDFETTEILSREFMEEMADEARKTVDDPDIVHWSGSVNG